ncbi:MAG: MFS transporter [Mycobacteriales bacterium]
MPTERTARRGWRALTSRPAGRVGPPRGRATNPQDAASTASPAPYSDDPAPAQSSADEGPADEGPESAAPVDATPRSAPPVDATPQVGTATPERCTTYHEVFAVREARYIFGGFVLSVLGDQLARVALAVLVYARTSSALLTALTYAVTFLPWVVGGPVLAAYADRIPRRSVLIFCDVGRAILIGGLALPGIPLPVLVGILFVATLLSPPFESARAALMPDILEGDRYVLGNALMVSTQQVGQVIGFAGGGAIVAVIGARGALAADASTFLLSAVLIWRGVQRRATSRRADTEPASVWRDSVAGLSLVFRDRRLRTIVLMVCSASAFSFAWEGITPPWAAELGGGARTVGLLLAVSPIGVVVGAVVIGRLFTPSARERLMYPLSVLAPLVLVLVAAVHSLLSVLVVLAISGFAMSFNLPLNAVFIRAIPGEFRGRAFGVANGGMQASQGLAILVAGAVTDVVAPSTAIALFGLVGTVVGAIVAAPLARPRKDRPSSA